MGIVVKDLEAELLAKEQLLEEAHKKAMEAGPTPATANTPEELKQAEEKFDPLAAPSGMFGLYLPHFIDLVNGLSNKSLKRVIRALIAYPLEDLKPNSNNEAEVTAYKIGQKLLESKYLMIFYTAMEAEEKNRQAAVARQAAKAAEQANSQAPQVQDESKEQNVSSETNNSEVNNG